MEESFWQDRWKTQKIGFHEAQTNPRLSAHFAALEVPDRGAVFVPLCGKSADIDWILANGHPVVGIEFNEDAVREVFARLALSPEVEKEGKLLRFSASDLTLYYGDFFALRPDHLPEIAAVYDRAAMVAVSPDTRQSYVDHLRRLSPGASRLLVSFDYDQRGMDGPPFSVPGSEVDRLYGISVTRITLQSDLITSPPGAVGLGREEVYLLKEVR